MFGIGGGELILIIFIALMLFGSDKIPDIARTMGKAMAQLKNATNDIKSEIQKSANADDFKSLTADFTSEIDNVKQGFNKIVSDNTSDIVGGNPLDINSEINSEINKVKENIDDLTGPIKRQL
jgi:sec-independent protein translocase protein TatA